ncbi:DUF2628 domain-containing protein [Proteus hauseri]|uniref:Membrane protein n=1 Tax=Proteus hauseri ATCC 700826 TaxID=1354271 RepID=A0AAJ3HSK7_PROHU|nr:DUF2628 domain-containing protein [Proteus hauseri]OAT47162.1 putative membrane protein [Proteus hauseri ATCC 700826]
MNKEYSAKWEERFAFIEQYGSPKSPEYKAAYKGLAFGKRILIGMNIWAFFFGFIYFLILGLWRKALTLLAVNIAIIIVISIIVDALSINPSFMNAVSIALNFLWAATANYAYYLKEKKNDQGWNPFAGIF